MGWDGGWIRGRGERAGEYRKDEGLRVAGMDNAWPGRGSQGPKGGSQESREGGERWDFTRFCDSTTERANDGGGLSRVQSDESPIQQGQSKGSLGLAGIAN